MRTKLNIPSRIRVGFQKRKDTYTGKLAYIYSMSKDGKRKDEPKSWTSWRDHGIAAKEFDNTPMEGFVLNRDVGGTQRSYDWNARRERVRVYDPRDFEFEITVENVLLILQECSSIKGKGLEGQFVLAWSGSSVVLLPVGCEEYNVAMEFQDLKGKKLGKDEVVEGCTYLNKDKENLMYMGRHPWFHNIPKGYYHCKNTLTGQKKHIFLKMDSIIGKNKRDIYNYKVENGFTNLATRTSDTPIPEYAREYEKLMKTTFVSTPAKLITDKPTFEVITKDYYYYTNSEETAVVGADGIIYRGDVFVNMEKSNRYGFSRDPIIDRRFDIKCYKTISIKDGGLIEKKVSAGEEYVKSNITFNELNQIACNVYIECENGSKYPLK
ncbi:MAG: hypothetical protein WC119_02335 [Synergistaceae bacterium]